MDKIKQISNSFPKKGKNKENTKQKPQKAEHF